MNRIFLIILLSTLITSCTQKGAPIVYKGHLYFTDTGAKPSNINNKLALKKPASDTRIETLNQITVKSGDNLYNLAKQYKLSSRQLIESNNLTPPYTLVPGQILSIPSKRKTHTITSGENLTNIARKYGVSLSELTQVNNISRNHPLKIGEVLILPYGAKTKKDNIFAKTKKIIKSKKVTFYWPIEGEIIQKFGAKKDGTHSDGINISAPAGTSIKAAAKGKVVYVGSELRGYGNLVIIKHPGNWLTAYAHNNEIFVAKNQNIKEGEVIGSVGASGNVSKSQLHFGLRKGRKAVDPQKYLKKRPKKSKKPKAAKKAEKPASIVPKKVNSN